MIEKPVVPVGPFAGKPSRSEDAKVLDEGPAHVTRSSRAFSDIGRSFAEMFHWGVVLRLLLGLLLAVAFASAIAWHPRRATRLDPLSDLEERKTLILLGLVGAVVAALVTAREGPGANEMTGYLAFVIFGIGALMRFRTALENPKLTGKAILVVVIGIASGLTEWALALWITIAAFLLIWFLDSHLACRVRISLGGRREANLEEGATTARLVLVENRCRVKGSSIDPQRRRIVLLAHMPAQLDPLLLEVALRSALAAQGDTPEVEVKVA
jgi:hypothetical protein